MRAVVLVGGFGTRLRPLTLGTPKQMLPVVDRPMIEWVVGHLAEHGVDEAVLSLGYKPDAFTEAYPDATCAGVRLTYAVEDEPLDTAGAIRFAATEAGIDERFLVVNGDVLTDLDVGALVRFHDAHGGAGTLHLIPVEDPSRYGVVPTDADGRVQAFVEKPSRDEAPSHWINAGTYVLEPEVLDRIAPEGRVSVERETFPALAAEGKLYGYEAETYWVDAGTAPTYLQSQLDLVDGHRSETPPAVAADAVVAEGAKVDHAVVMTGASVADGALVADSAVLPGARVEAGATVRDSIVGPRAVVGADAVVDGGTVLGDGRGRRARRGADRRPTPRGGLVKTLVTGGAGFIGSTLVDRLLADGHDVVVVDDLSSGSEANLVDARTADVRKIDIRDDAATQVVVDTAPEVVFHLAAQADVRVSVARPTHDASINVIGLLKVLEGARQAGTRKVVFASSGGTIYGEPDPSVLPIDESNPELPISPYGVAKKVGTDYLRAYQAVHGLDWTSLALANVYGPRQDPHGEAGVVAIFAGLLLDRKPCTVFGTGEQTRDYVYVDDVVDAFARAADAGSGELYNIGTGQETSVNALYQAMADAAGVTDPPTYVAARPGELDRSALDASKAQRELDWSPRVSLEDGVRTTLDWTRARRS